MKLKYLITSIIIFNLSFWSSLSRAADLDLMQLGIRACNAEATYNTLNHYDLFNNFQEARDFKEESLDNCYKNSNAVIEKTVIEKNEDFALQNFKENYVKSYTAISAMLAQHQYDIPYLKFYRNIVYFHFGI